jgi:hypothetical protein
MDPSKTDRSLYERGLEVRRDVLGAEHVDSSLQTASDFILPMQAARHRVLLGGRVGARRTRSAPA